jgi:hypothetical protein
MSYVYFVQRSHTYVLHFDQQQFDYFEDKFDGFYISKVSILEEPYNSRITLDDMAGNQRTNFTYVKTIKFIFYLIDCLIK